MQKTIIVITEMFEEVDNMSFIIANNALFVLANNASFPQQMMRSMH